MKARERNELGCKSISLETLQQTTSKSSSESCDTVRIRSTQNPSKAPKLLTQLESWVQDENIQENDQQNICPQPFHTTTRTHVSGIHPQHGVLDRHMKWKSVWDQRKSKVHECSCMSFEDKYSHTLARQATRQLLALRVAHAREYQRCVIRRKTLYILSSHAGESLVHRQTHMLEYYSKRLLRVCFSALQFSIHSLSQSLAHLQHLHDCRQKSSCLHVWLIRTTTLVQTRRRILTLRIFKGWYALGRSFRRDRLFTWWRVELRRQREIDEVKSRLFAVVEGMNLFYLFCEYVRYTVTPLMITGRCMKIIYMSILGGT
jgi:hypothetical protein